MSATDPLPETPRRSPRTAAVVTVVVALLAGILMGIAVDRAWMWKHRGRFADRAMRAMTPRILARLDAELDLTPAQHAGVARILEAHHQRVTSLLRAGDPQIRHEMDVANREIETLLSPAQRAKFDTLKLRMRRPGAGPPH